MCSGGFCQKKERRACFGPNCWPTLSHLEQPEKCFCFCWKVVLDKSSRNKDQPYFKEFSSQFFSQKNKLGGRWGWLKTELFLILFPIFLQPSLNVYNSLTKKYPDTSVDVQAGKNICSLTVFSSVVWTTAEGVAVSSSVQYTHDKEPDVRSFYKLLWQASAVSFRSLKCLFCAMSSETACRRHLFNQRRMKEQTEDQAGWLFSLCLNLFSFLQWFSWQPNGQTQWNRLLNDDWTILLSVGAPP